MKKFLIVTLGLTLIVGLTGCDKQENILSEVDLTDPEVIEKCDNNNDGEVTKEELEKCDDDLIIGGGSSNQNDEEENDGNERLDGEDKNDRNERLDDEEEELTVALKDVRAKYANDDIVITFDRDTEQAKMEAEGEVTYLDTDGYFYGKTDEGWMKAKFVGASGFVTQEYPELAYTNPDNAYVPSAIPVADMPYKAKYQNISKAYVGNMGTCSDGRECEIFELDGGILRYDADKRLVEASIDGILVLFEHGDFSVNAPAAQLMEIPAMGGF